MQRWKQIIHIVNKTLQLLLFQQNIIKCGSGVQLAIAKEMELSLQKVRIIRGIEYKPVKISRKER